MNKPTKEHHTMNNYLITPPFTSPTMDKVQDYFIKMSTRYKHVKFTKGLATMAKLFYDRHSGNNWAAIDGINVTDWKMLVVMEMGKHII